MFSNNLLEACQASQRIMLTGPSSTDGDSIGACLGLKYCIEQKTDATVDLFGTLSFRYAQLPGAEYFKDNKLCIESYDLAIVVDGNRFRLHPTLKSNYDQAKTSVLIDHHQGNVATDYHLCWVDPSAPSTCSMIAELSDAWSIEWSQDFAAAIYTGLVFDTGGFRHSNTTAATHELASRLLQTGIDGSTITTRTLYLRQARTLPFVAQALNSVQLLEDGQIAVSIIPNQLLSETRCGLGDLEGVIDMLRTLDGVELACIATQIRTDRLKVSLRSNRSVDVSQVARGLSSRGGGHARAAGATMEGDIEVLKSTLLSTLSSAINDSAEASNHDH